jgi:hypothetical protein
MLRKLVIGAFSALALATGAAHADFLKDSPSWSQRDMSSVYGLVDFTNAKGEKYVLYAISEPHQDGSVKVTIVGPFHTEVHSYLLSCGG